MRENIGLLCLVGYIYSLVAVMWWFFGEGAAFWWPLTVCLLIVVFDPLNNLSFSLRSIIKRWWKKK